MKKQQTTNVFAAAAGGAAGGAIGDKKPEGKPSEGAGGAEGAVKIDEANKLQVEQAEREKLFASKSLDYVT